MKIVDCFWELANLDRKVAEISLSSDDKVEDVDAALTEVEKSYDYIVVKMSTAEIALNQLMCRRNYMFMETQITYRKRLEDLKRQIENDKRVQLYLRNSEAKRVESEEELKELLDSMTQNMFHTDRIYLDPEFSPEYSLRRYKNWIASEYKRGTIIKMFYFRKAFIGFSMCRHEGNVLHGLLSGVYEKYQNAGMGLFIPLIPYYFQEYTHKEYFGNVSTNNVPSIRVHDAYNFENSDMTYVFVKHIKH